MSDDMRGLFFIVKGQYKKGVAPSFVNSVTGDVQHIGGYNPYDDTTSEWFMLMDSKTFHCIACGSDLDKVLRSVYTAIVKHKGDAKRYFKYVSSITSDDYYETHYLGKSPLTHDQRVKKAEGRCPRVSPTMRCLYEHIYAEYGDFFSEEIEKMEDLAYKELSGRKPINKTKKIMAKTKKVTTKVETKTPTPKVETPEVMTPKKLVKPKVRVGVKKLNME